MMYRLFDSLTHIKKDLIWYKTSKKADPRDLKLFFNAQEISGSVIACMPDDDLGFIIETIDEDLPFCKLVVCVSPEWLNLSFSELCKKLQILKNQKSIIGIKIHPRFCGIPLENIDYIKVLIAAAKHVGMLVYICTLLRKPVHPNSDSPNILIKKILDLNPDGDADIVLLHGGYTDILATSEVVRDYEGVWLDLSFTFMRFRKSSLALDIGYLFETLDEKCVIGTDYPECTPMELIDNLKYYVFDRSDLNLNETKIKAVLNDNMKRLVDKYGL